MLEPAILYKQEIEDKIRERFYTEDMLYMTGCLYNWTPEICDRPDESTFQYAIVDEYEAVGYLGYTIDWYASKAYNFGLFSFDRGNPIVGSDVFNKLEELVGTMHRIEWRAIEGNPVIKHYDAFCKKHNGVKHVLKDAVKDSRGRYRDDIIYEIVTDKHTDDVDYVINELKKCHGMANSKSVDYAEGLRDAYERAIDIVRLSGNVNN